VSFPLLLPSQSQLIQRGCYQYYSRAANQKNFVDANIKEYFQWSRTPQGRGQIQTLRDASKTTFGVKLGLTVHLPDWSDILHPAAVEMSMKDCTQNPLAEATYLFSKNQIDLGRTIALQELPQEQVELHNDAVFYPLMRNFAGEVILTVAERPNGSATIFLPDIRQPQSNSLFAVQRSSRRAWSEGDIVQENLAGRTWKCSVYRFTGGPYDESCRFWIDIDSHLVIRYTFESADGSHWRAELTDIETILSNPANTNKELVSL